MEGIEERLDEIEGSNYRARERVDYGQIVRETKAQFKIRVKKWRRSMAGSAWKVIYLDGREINWIEAPKPKTPISLAIYLHEVGHHAIGFNSYRLKCEEEYHAWVWGLDKMREYGVEPDKRVVGRFVKSMVYAVGKAKRRKIKNLPDVLKRFDSAS